jgi:hypothetical protein
MRKSDNLRVSFVIPVRNDARRLQRCLASIRANCNGPRLALIVVDNGSTDSSVEVARQWGATVLERPGLSVSELRNAGALAADGDVLAFVDADHEIASDWTVHAVATLCQENVGAAGAPYEAPTDGTWVQRTYDLLRARARTVRDVEWLGSGNLVIWREVFESIGGFDTTLETCEDVDLCRRVRLAGLRILQNPTLKSVHLGDPASLREVFRGELWRGRDNIRVSLRPPFSLRGVPSVVVPVANVLLMGVALVGMLSATRLGAVTAVVAFVLIAGASAARAARMVTNQDETTLLGCARALVVAGVYDLARALALVHPGGHEGRRGRGR